MNRIRIACWVAMLAVLSGCQSRGPESASHSRSVYSGDHSLLYRVRGQAASPEQAMQMAAQAYRAGDRDQALYLYLRALELDPKQSAALLGVGRIHRERGNGPLAEQAFAEVLASDPQHPDGLAEMGLLQLARRNQSKAAELLNRAVLLDQRRLGLATEHGLPEVDALKVDKHSPLKVYNGLGVLADLDEDFPLSEAYYRLALQIDPRSALVQNSLGYSYYLAGQWPEAERSYRRGIDYDASYSPLWRNYGLLLARSNRYEEALSAFEHLGSRAQASNEVGYVCLAEGKLDTAEQFFRSAIEQSPGHYATAWENLERVQQLRRIRQLGAGAEALAGVPLDEPAAR